MRHVDRNIFLSTCLMKLLNDFEKNEEKRKQKQKGNRRKKDLVKLLKNVEHFPQKKKKGKKETGEKRPREAPQRRLTLHSIPRPRCTLPSTGPSKQKRGEKELIKDMEHFTKRQQKGQKKRKKAHQRHGAFTYSYEPRRTLPSTRPSEILKSQSPRIHNT